MLLSFRGPPPKAPALRAPVSAPRTPPKAPAPAPAPDASDAPRGRYRAGVAGGRQRFGDSGGANREYYQAFYSAKGKGRTATERAAIVQRFIEANGPPPGRGGTAFHERKRD